MSLNSINQLSTKTSFFSLHITSWVIFIISCISIIIIIIIIIILITILCFCNCFPRQHRSEDRAFLVSNDANIYSRNHNSSSVKKSLLSFNGSDHIINMVPQECEVIRPTSYCENEMEHLSNIRQYYSRICHWFSMKEIIEATNNFHCRNLIGVGCYGKVYRGFLLDGTRIAVKELIFTRVKTEYFKRVVEEIPTMSHKNLVKILGFCVEESDLCTRYILVCEYVDNGNLHQWLHANDVGFISPLTWRIRMDIISGIAKGLSYMHEDFGEKMVHTRLQSHKILLDRRWNPKISDFAIAKLLDQSRFCPYEIREMNEKEDVYSFGILVMEIISGRKPIENNRLTEEQQLVKWLKKMVSDQNYEQVVDPKIPQLPSLKELKRILLIAFRCADLDAKNRPKMGEVLHMLEPRDLLLSDGQDVYRRSFSKEPDLFSDQMSMDSYQDYDLRDEKHLRLCNY